MVRILKHVSFLGVLITTLGTGLFLVLVGVAQESVRHQPVVVVQGGMLSSISAESIYIFDLESGVTIFTRNPSEVRPIASVTKLLSSALFLEYATDTDITTITSGDVRTEGRSGRLQAGQQYTNRDLLFPALLESSNDAAAVMERVSPNLVGQMNRYASSHGLPSTHFVDTSGLADGNVSTAYELGALAVALYQEYPYILDMTRLKTYLNHVNAWMNNNPFVRDEGYRGGKHGYTDAANRTAAAFFDEELQSGEVRTVGYVLLGSDALQTDMKRLRAYVQRSVAFE